MALIECHAQIGCAVAITVNGDRGAVLRGNDVRRGVFKKLVGPSGHRFYVLANRQGVHLAGIARIDDVHRARQNRARRDGPACTGD